MFTLPVAIDVYHGSNKIRYNVWVRQKTDTFTFASPAKPDLVNFDGDKALLTEKKENKTLDEYLHQYKHAHNYLDRKEAIDAAAEKQEEQKAVEILILALADPYHGLRSYTIERLDLRKQALKTLAENPLFKMAQADPKRTVKAAAIAKLGDYGFAKYIPFYQAALKDSSYSVAGSALEAIGKVDSSLALKEAQQLAKHPAKGKLAEAISKTLILYGDEASADYILSSFEKMPFGQAKFDALGPLAQFLAKIQSTNFFKRGVDNMLQFKNDIPEAYKEQVSGYIDNLLRNVQKAKSAVQQKEQANYIESKLTKEDKKGF